MRRAETDGLPAGLPANRPKGEALREILEALVASLGPGAELPSERVLAEHFGLARMTVRTEIDRLVTEGLVYRLHGRGTFVAEPRVAQAVLFSSFSEDMRARGMTPGSVVRSREQIEAGPFLARTLEVATGAPVAELERVRTADGEPMALERVYLPAERFPGIADADLEHGSLFEVLAERYDTNLSGADQRVVAVAIEAEEAPLLGVDAGVPGLRFHTLARDTRGIPAYYATSLFRGDRYEIELHQTRTPPAGAQTPAAPGGVEARTAPAPTETRTPTGSAETRTPTGGAETRTAPGGAGTRPSPGGAETRPPPAGAQADAPA